MSDQRRLTGKEQAFADRIIAGEQPSAAYKAAGYAQCNPNVTAVAAHRIGNRPAVLAYVDAAKSRLTAKATLTRERKLERLKQRVEHGDMIDREGIKALEVHNLMTGDNAPQQVNVFGLTDLLQMVRKGSK